LAKTAKKVKFHFDVSEFEPLECVLLKQTEFLGYHNRDEEVEYKEGKYHGSMFWEVDDFGSKKWVVCVRIQVDWEEYFAKGVTKDELFGRLIAHLNLPPKRKKFQRRQTKPRYGKLSPVSLWIYPKEENGVKFLSALVITDKKRCRHFFGQGPADMSMKSVRRMRQKKG
jgi:hypothetical protein